MEIALLQKVDALAVGVYPTPERKNKMDFGYIIIAESYCMVVPRPGEEPRLFAFIRPFTPKVNMPILYSYLFICKRHTREQVLPGYFTYSTRLPEEAGRFPFFRGFPLASRAEGGKRKSLFKT